VSSRDSICRSFITQTRTGFVRDNQGVVTHISEDHEGQANLKFIMLVREHWDDIEKILKEHVK
jgi:hypothetical protein